jgi:hypothetical protein
VGEDPVGALIGAILLGFGIAMMYGGVKNRALFGEKGIITTAIREGKIPDASKLPDAFAPLAKLTSVAREGEVKATWGMPLAVGEAITTIAAADPGLAAKIADNLSKLDSDSKKEEAQPLLQLLMVAESAGFREEAETIRKYVTTLVVSLK